MAKSILEQLKALLSEDERKALEAKLAANPALLEQDSKATEIFSIYLGDEDPATVSTEAAKKTPVAEPAKPAAAAVSTTAASAPAGDSAQILEQLRTLNATVDAKFKDLDKHFVTVESVKTLGNQLTNSAARVAAKLADDLSQVRQSHRVEFSEELDRDAFEKFVEDHTPVLEYEADGKTAKRLGPSPYKNMKEAHDAFVADKRVAKKIETGIADGIKQKKSGTEVPGQTQSLALSPAQQIMAKAREKKNGEEKSNAMAAAEKLAALRRTREEGEAVQ